MLSVLRWYVNTRRVGALQIESVEPFQCLFDVSRHAPMDVMFFSLEEHGDTDVLLRIAHLRCHRVKFAEGLDQMFRMCYVCVLDEKIVYD